ncbi:MAG: rhodanese-like domain-containing protein [Rubrivivax sp.]|nr:rhodanese-like domain-containing protein [Rubrivivax sp.]
MPLRYADLLAQARAAVRELMPWDLAPQLAAAAPPLVLDVREPAEFAALHIEGALNVPRGVLEQACEWDHDETEPSLAGIGDRAARAIVVVCRSGKRSLLAAHTLRQLGYEGAVSLATGLRGWNDAEQPLVDAHGHPVDGDTAEALLAPRLRPEQRRPRG